MILFLTSASENDYFDHSQSTCRRRQHVSHILIWLLIVISSLPLVRTYGEQHYLLFFVYREMFRDERDFVDDANIEHAINEQASTKYDKIRKVNSVVACEWH
jgi:hypothetical protein